MSDTTKMLLTLLGLVVLTLVIVQWALPAALREWSGIPAADHPDCLARAHEVDSWPFFWIDPEELCSG